MKTIFTLFVLFLGLGIGKAQTADAKKTINEAIQKLNGKKFGDLRVEKASYENDILKYTVNVTVFSFGGNDEESYTEYYSNIEWPEIKEAGITKKDRNIDYIHFSINSSGYTKKVGFYVLDKETKSVMKAIEILKNSK